MREHCRRRPRNATVFASPCLLLSHSACSADSHFLSHTGWGRLLKTWTYCLVHLAPNPHPGPQTLKAKTWLKWISVLYSLALDSSLTHSTLSKPRVSTPPSLQMKMPWPHFFPKSFSKWKPKKNVSPKYWLNNHGHTSLCESVLSHPLKVTHDNPKVTSYTLEFLDSSWRVDRSRHC